MTEPRSLLESLRQQNIVAFLQDGELTVRADKGLLTAEIKREISQNKAELIRELHASLDHWIGRVYTVTTIDGVLQIVDEFRTLDWSDEQRAQMARAYIRRIGLLQLTS